MLEALERFHINFDGRRVGDHARNGLSLRRDRTDGACKALLTIGTHAELDLVSYGHLANITLIDVGLDTQRGQILDLDEAGIASGQITPPWPTSDRPVDRRHNPCMRGFEFCIV